MRYYEAQIGKSAWKCLVAGRDKATLSAFHTLSSLVTKTLIFVGVCSLATKQLIPCLTYYDHVTKIWLIRKEECHLLVLVGWASVLFIDQSSNSQLGPKTKNLAGEGGL